jgi:hypothetical protein
MILCYKQKRLLLVGEELDNELIKNIVIEKMTGKTKE